MDSNYANKGDELIKKGDKQLKGTTFPKSRINLWEYFWVKAGES